MVSKLIIVALLASALTLFIVVSPVVVVSISEAHSEIDNVQIKNYIKWQRVIQELQLRKVTQVRSSSRENAYRRINIAQPVRRISILITDEEQYSFKYFDNGKIVESFGTDFERPINQLTVKIYVEPEWFRKRYLTGDTRADRANINALVLRTLYFLSLDNQLLYRQEDFVEFAKNSDEFIGSHLSGDNYEIIEIN